jgi:hypothetical protein
MESSLLPPQLAATENGGVNHVVVRHIARDHTQPPDIIARGAARQLSWPDVYKCIATAVKDATAVVKMDMVDTAVVERRDVLHYTYTDVEGRVTLKPKNVHNLRSIHAEFMKIAYAIQGDTPKHIALAYRLGSAAPVVLPVDDFEAYCFELVTAPTFSAEVEMVQCFVPSKGTDSHYRTYRTAFWLEQASSTPQMRTERLDVPAGVTGSAGIRSKLNMSRQANKTMEATVQQVVKLVERGRRCRVTRAGFDFVQDHNGKIWLLGSSECVVAVHPEGEAAGKRAASPVELKLSRSAQLADMDLQRHDDDDDDGGGDGRPRQARFASTDGDIGRVGRRGGSRKGRAGVGGPRSPSSRQRPEVPEARLGDDVPDEGPFPGRHGSYFLGIAKILAVSFVPFEIISPLGASLTAEGGGEGGRRREEGGTVDVAARCEEEAAIARVSGGAASEVRTNGVWYER